VILDINPAFVRNSEFPREQLVGQSVGNLPIFANPEQLANVGRMLTEQRFYSNIEITFRTRTGKVIPALVSATTFELAGERCALCIAKDMRDLRTVEERLRSSEERFRSAFENAPIGILLIDLEGNIFQANRFAAEMLAFGPDDLPGRNIIRLLPEDTRVDLEVRLARLPDSENRAMQLERRLCRNDGLEIWTNFRVAMQSGDDGPAYCIVQIADITEMKLSQERMERMAFYDTLTDLANRRLFHDRLCEVLERRTGTAALLYLDLDRFKRVNDTLGHEAGDNLLREVGNRISRSVRRDDLVARLGGDEFTILLSEIQMTSDAAVIADRILSELRKPMQISGHSLVVTTSIGVTVFPDDGTDADQLMKNADLAMYKAKERGRNNFQFFREDMNASAERKLRTEHELRRALERHELELYYQPKVRISDQRIVGMECLLRWNHPERGLLLPVEFIEVAEETGIIIPIGNWVIGEACRATKHLVASYGAPLRIAINISPLQFRDPNLVQIIRRALRESELEASCLELEITETMLMDAVEAAAMTIDRLHELGVKLAIDDFGTGYSSLNYLKKFPIDTVKVDRSFVKDIPNDPDDMEITAAVIAMAHRLKMAVVAEGVETAEQLAFLSQHNCEYAQGFLFSQAQPLEAITRLLAPNVRLLHGR
jgi:diguanylate cyclase (GGDEF)-like protein/PAS domain S-box-containing protein